MKERYRAGRNPRTRLQGSDATDSPDAIPEADDEIEGMVTASDLDSLHISDSSPDDLTADTLMGDPREEKLRFDDEDEELRAPHHHWIHRKPRSPGLRARHPRH